MEKVFFAGKAHGAQPEDVYGCLYFFLSDQLRAFARHIRQHRISFHVFNSEACALAQHISQGELAELGVPSTTRFDRIDVSNIMDPNYVGIRGVMNSWGPLLVKTDHAALTGYFMNWVADAEKGRVADAGPSALKGTLDLMRKSNRVCCQVVHFNGTIAADLVPSFVVMWTQYWPCISLWMMSTPSMILQRHFPSIGRNMVVPMSNSS